MFSDLLNSGKNVDPDTGQRYILREERAVFGPTYPVKCARTFPKAGSSRSHAIDTL